MKNYNAETGVRLDSSFLSHQSYCERCKQFDASQPASATLLCLEGSVLWKRENVAELPRPAPKERRENIVSKAKLKQIMRYKE